MPAHIYVRVSTDEQAEDGYSLQAQERACRLYCAALSTPLVRVWCDDGYSGTSAARPAFLAMLAAAQPGDLILVHKLDRFSRNVRLLLDTLESLKEKNISLLSVSEQIDFSSPIGRVMLTLLAAFAQYYVDNLREETAKGWREKAQRGRWVGPVPIGYQKRADGVLEPSGDAETIRELYRLYLAGRSYLEVAAELNRRGLRGPAGHVWGRENVRVVLRGRAYLGKVSAGGVEFDGAHEPIVSVDTWEAAASRRAAMTRQPATGGPRAAGAVAGLLYCAHCGKKLWFKYGGSNDCRSYYCRGAGRGSCAAPQFRADLVEQAAADLVDLVAADDIHQVAEALYVADGEIARVAPKERYRRLLAKIGIQVVEKRPPAETEGRFKA